MRPYGAKVVYYNRPGICLSSVPKVYCDKTVRDGAILPTYANLIGKNTS